MSSVCVHVCVWVTGSGLGRTEGHRSTELRAAFFTLVHAPIPILDPMTRCFCRLWAWCVCSFARKARKARSKSYGRLCTISVRVATLIQGRGLMSPDLVSLGAVQCLEDS